MSMIIEENIMVPNYFDWLAHPALDEYWRTLVPEEIYERIAVPALTIAGWYDFFQQEDLEHYQSMKQRGGSALARTFQHLIIGPWSHGNFMSRYRFHRQTGRCLPG